VKVHQPLCSICLAYTFFYYYYYYQNISILIDKKYTMPENQQVRIQWFTKAGNKLPDRTLHQSQGKEANKLSLTDNGYVRNHKLQGSQPNTKQKSRQVDGLGTNWSRKHKVYQTRMQKTHEYHAAQQIFKRNSNNQRPIRNICNAAWRAANWRENRFPQESSSRTATNIVSWH
jgi:hypothetical protein